MTYIEFFDKVVAENVITCLSYAPDRVIYIGHDPKIIECHIKHYRRVFEERGCSIVFEGRSVPKNRLKEAIDLLTEIVETYDDCVFDISGGEEVLLLALGMVYASHPDKNIQIHRFNPRNNAVYDYDQDGRTLYWGIPTVTVDENVRLHGGDVVYGTVSEKLTYRWELHEEFLEDLGEMWRICKGNVRLWNVQIGIFAAVEEVGKVSEDGLTTTVSWGALEQHLTQNHMKYKRAKGMIQALLKAGLLIQFADIDGVSVTYKDPQVKRCLTTAGQVLELRVFTVAKALTDGQGVPVYDDAVNGVFIDWDGELHDEETEEIYDTENEMDVLLMHDSIPVFISCKNGKFTADELYKLQTVAERFGGPYAKKVLVTTALSTMGNTAEYIRQRARDMKIRLVEDVQKMDDEALGKKLVNLWKS